MDYLIGAVIGLVLGAAAVYAFVRGSLEGRFRTRERDLEEQVAQRRKEVEEEARQAAKESLASEIAERRQTLDAEERRLAREREQLDQELEDMRQRRKKLDTREATFTDREEGLQTRQAACDKKEGKLLKREEALEAQETQLAEQHEELTTRQQELADRLQEVAGLSKDEARQLLLKQLDDELTAEQSATIAKRRAEMEERSKELANEFIARAIQRYAAEHTVETTAAKVPIKEEEMKGRIIGKEGRNIRAFEMATGVDLVIDDTPGIITVSSFDGIRREIARRTLLELLEDGRVHPARIEEVLSRVQQDMDREVLKLGEDAAYNVDVSGLHPKLLKLLGKLNFRTSYGQNNLQHTQEVAFLSGALAADLGLDPKLARRCGLMHDIGKSLDHDQEGSHPELGAEALRRYGENDIVVNAALAHHEGHEVTSIYTVLTAAADAISAARPGARRENSERFIKRMEQLEDIACTFEGVMKAYAIQAGRELRVIINNHKLRDDALAKTARSIARRIESEVAYPGEVKVTLIREVRSTATAR